MQRNTTALTDGEFDVLIIGGGAFGAAAARDAALRGLRTALIERADFGGGASAECFKMVHGGIRYLQHADVPRLRASCRERSALLRIAPHLVQPLPIAIPTYGYGRRGRAFLGAGACAYDLLTARPKRRHTRIRNARSDARRFLSRTRGAGELFPHLRAPDLIGAVVFEDGQMYNPARLVLAFVKGAVAAGATVCNYVEAQRFLWDGVAVRGVRVRDHLSGEILRRARAPDAERRRAVGGLSATRSGTLRRLRARPVLARRLLHRRSRARLSEYGVAVQGLSRDKDALLGRSTRHLFAAPWRDKTLLGVWHRHFPGVSGRRAASSARKSTAGSTN